MDDRFAAAGTDPAHGSGIAAPAPLTAPSPSSWATPRLLAPLFLVAAALSAPASAQTINLGFDDGQAENSWGSICPALEGETVPWAWVNRFRNTTGGFIRVTHIRVAFGAPNVDHGLMLGDAVNGLVYVDQLSTGNLANATLRAYWSLPGGVHATNGSTFKTFTIPNGGVIVAPGVEFYLGVADIESGLDMAARFPAAIDMSNPHWRSFSFGTTGPCEDEVFDPESPGAGSTISPAPGDWMVRGIAAPTSGPQGDVNGDSVVNTIDLALVLGSWGACAGGCPPDFNSDNFVNAADLATVLGNWTH